MSNEAWVALVWLALLIATPIVLWAAHRRYGRIDWNELEQTAPRPPASNVARCLPPESFGRRNDRTDPQARAEIARLEKAYAMPDADVDH